MVIFNQTFTKKLTQHLAATFFPVQPYIHFCHPWHDLFGQYFPVSTINHKLFLSIPMQ
jgi:hypothetical protein